MDLPAFDTRPTNPLFGYLSTWLCGENPLDPADRPETISELAEALGVSAAKLHQIRATKSFRRFHSAHTSSLDEIVIRRREMLDRLYELGSSGNVTAMNAYLTQTKMAPSMAAKGKDSEEGTDLLLPGDAAQLTDEELARLSGQTTTPN